MQAEQGVLLTVKDVLDYNKAEAQAAKETTAGGGGPEGDMGGLGGGGDMGGDFGGDMGGLDGGDFDEFDDSAPPTGGLEGGDLDMPDALEPPDDIEQDIEENKPE